MSCLSGYEEKSVGSAECKGQRVKVMLFKVDMDEQRERLERGRQENGYVIILEISCSVNCTEVNQGVLSLQR